MEGFFVMIRSMNDIYNTIQSWSLNHGISILGVAVAVIIVNSFAHLFIEKTIRRVIKGASDTDPEAEKKREDTLIKVIHGVVRVLAWLIGGMMIVSEFGVDIGPHLAAAGVVGIAVGFGGQYLIRDVIAGLFIILENQYRVGDVICITGTCGSVEHINLRLTIIRDLDGVVHHIPNGEVSIASNLTKQYSRVNLDIGVGYSSDIEQVERVINQIGNDLATDVQWKDKIISAPQFVRVHDFADSSIVIKILGDTIPGAQWAVLGELRKRIKIAFDKEGIEIPFPQRVIHQK